MHFLELQRQLSRIKTIVSGEMNVVFCVDSDSAIKNGVPIFPVSCVPPQPQGAGLVG